MLFLPVPDTRDAQRVFGHQDVERRSFAALGIQERDAVYGDCHLTGLPSTNFTLLMKRVIFSGSWSGSGKRYWWCRLCQTVLRAQSWAPEHCGEQATFITDKEARERVEGRKPKIGKLRSLKAVVANREAYEKKIRRH